MRIRVLAGLVFAVLGVFFLQLIINGTGTMADVLRGYESMRQYWNGGDFNTVSYPSVDNPIYTYYIGWWSPGQWYAPFLLLSAGISSIITAQGILIISCLTISLIGFFRLFRSLNFSPWICWISLLSIVSSQCFYWHTFLYYGGDLFILAIIPHFVLFILKQQRYSLIKRVVYFTLFALIGTFAKNTFVIFILCSFIFLLVQSWSDNKLKRIYDWLPTILAGVIVLSVVYWGHLSRGETPASAIDQEGYGTIPNDLIGDLSYSFGSPIGILTRFSIFIQKIGNNQFINLFQVVPLLFMLVFYVRSFFNKEEKYHQLILWFCLPFFAAFTLFYLQDKAISYEMRHFAPVAFLVFPGIMQWAYSFRYKKLVTVAILLFCFMDLGLYAINVRQLEVSHMEWNDYKLPTEDVAVMKEMMKWDDKHSDALVIIDDYWQLSIAQVQCDKLVLRRKKNVLEVVSGMELDCPDNIDQLDPLLNQYSNILHVSKKKLKESITLPINGGIKLFETNQFELLSYTKLK